MKYQKFNLNGMSYEVGYNFEYSPSVCKINGKETNLKCIPNTNENTISKDVYYTNLSAPNNNYWITAYCGKIYCCNAHNNITDMEFVSNFIGKAVSDKHMVVYTILHIIFSVILFLAYAIFIGRWSMLIPFFATFSIKEAKESNIIPKASKAIRKQKLILQIIITILSEITLPIVVNLIFPW